MSTLKVIYLGCNVEVEYEYTPYEAATRTSPESMEWVELYDYRFETEEEAEDCGLYDERSRAYLEGGLIELILDYERSKKNALKSAVSLVKFDKFVTLGIMSRKKYLV